MQGVLVFASSAARASAITSPQEGQYSYLKDTNSTEYYDGAAWIAAPIGDITGVTAGTGISGGGTSGTVTVAIDSTVATLTGSQTLTNKTLTSPALTTPTISTLTTNGDLLYGTGSGALARLGIGTTGQVVTVASGIPSWATPASGGGYTSIASGTLSSAALSITSIAGTYKALVLELRDITKSSAFDVNIQFNTDSGANYGNVMNRNVNNTLSTVGAIASTAMTVNGSGFKASTQYNQLIVKIDGYAQTDMWKICSFYGSGTDTGTSAREIFQGAGTWTSTSAITSIQTDGSMSLKYQLWGLS
jgi:hypothetical protein